MYCKKCYYCLENLGAAVVCPECGGGFRKGDYASFLDRLPERHWLLTLIEWSGRVNIFSFFIFLSFIMFPGTPMLGRGTFLYAFNNLLICIALLSFLVYALSLLCALVAGMGVKIKMRFWVWFILGGFLNVTLLWMVFYARGIFYIN